MLEMGDPKIVAISWGKTDEKRKNDCTTVDVLEMYVDHRSSNLPNLSCCSDRVAVAMGT